MNKKTLFFLIAIVFIGAVAFTLDRYTARPTQTVSQDKVRVAASFYPLYYFATQIGGDAVTVMNITPAGAEPHDYEPTPKDMTFIQKSDIILLNGAGFEPWAADLRDTIDAERTHIVEVGTDLADQFVSEEGERIQDPHVWLSPKHAKTMVRRISEALVTLDPAHAETYEANAILLEGRLDDLDRLYATALSSCARTDIVTSHAAFGYLASAYGLDQVAIAGIDPEAEPTPKALGDIASYAKRNGTTHIFFESLVSPKLSETIATEIGAKTLVLDPIEGISDEALRAGEEYFSVMRANLDNLTLALACNK